MKVLVYGAGVIGTLYGAKLANAGHKVTVVARGQRFADICQYGLVLEDIVHRRRWTAQVKAVERLSPDDEERSRLDHGAPRPAVKRRGGVGDQQAHPYATLHAEQSHGLGRACGGLGSRSSDPRLSRGGRNARGHVVTYAMIAQQPTTLGELDGRRTVRLDTRSKAFRDAGLPTHICADMDAWLKAHAFFVTAMCGAIYLASGDCRKLSKDNAALRLMTNGVREGFAAVRALGLPVMPFSLRVLFTWLPDAFAVAYWRRFLAAEMADYVFGRHARAAAQEMHDIANDCRLLLKRSGVEGPALLSLYHAIDAYIGESTSN